MIATHIDHDHYLHQDRVDLPASAKEISERDIQKRQSEKELKAAQRHKIILLS